MSHTFKCYYCGSKKIRLNRIINDFKLYKCLQCKLLFTLLDGKDGSEASNKKNYDSLYIKGYLLRAAKLQARFRERIKEIERIKKGGKILDIGCGIGLFLETLQQNSEYVWKTHGVDINKELIKIARQRTKISYIQKGSLGSTRFSKGFDCVTCFDVLEHDSKLSKNIREIRRNLKADGLLVLQVPNYKSMMAFLCGENWDWWLIPDHILHFTPSTLCKILEDQGFIIKTLFTWEPREEFVENIAGSFKKNLPHIFSLNRIIAKFSKYPLCFFWYIILPVKKVFNIGALTVIFAQKS